MIDPRFRLAWELPNELNIATKPGTDHQAPQLMTGAWLIPGKKSLTNTPDGQLSHICLHIPHWSENPTPAVQGTVMIALTLVLQRCCLSGLFQPLEESISRNPSLSVDNTHRTPIPIDSIDV